MDTTTILTPIKNTHTLSENYSICSYQNTKRSRNRIFIRNFDFIRILEIHSYIVKFQQQQKRYLIKYLKGHLCIKYPLPPSKKSGNLSFIQEAEIVKAANAFSHCVMIRLGGSPRCASPNNLHVVVGIKNVAQLSKGYFYPKSNLTKNHNRNNPRAIISAALFFEIISCANQAKFSSDIGW